MILEPSIAAVMRLAQVGEASDALKLFVLFNADVDGAAISHRLYSSHWRRRQMPLQNTEMMHHASCFVCAVRRAGRLLEAMVSRRASFPAPVAEVIQLEWNKKRTFFEGFHEPRNAIEHIDSAAKEECAWLFFHLHNHSFTVTGGTTIDIGQPTLDKVLAVQDAIVSAINTAIPDPMLDAIGHLESEGEA